VYYSQVDWAPAPTHHRNGGVNVVVAGSYQAMSLHLAMHMFNVLRELPAGSIILLRAPRGTDEPIGKVEAVAAQMATDLQLDVELCFPPVSGGREGVFKRDYGMVERADRVVAYFSPDKVMDGGTGHLIEAAMNRDIPTEAWRLDENGHLERVGDWP
jgi:hypothetical protein